MTRSLCLCSRCFGSDKLLVDVLGCTTEDIRAQKMIILMCNPYLDISPDTSDGQILRMI